MTNIIRTTIYAEEEKEFRLFLENAGFSNFDLFPNKDEIYLNIYASERGVGNASCGPEILEQYETKWGRRAWWCNC